MIHYILSKKKKKKKDTYISTSLYRLFVENDFFPSTFHIKIVINYIDLHKIPGGKKKTTGHNLSFLSKNIIRSVQDLLEMDVHFFTLSTLCISLRFMKLV